MPMYVFCAGLNSCTLYLFWSVAARYKRTMNKHLATSEAMSAEVHGTGLEIHVLTGTVWVTQESDPEDHVLQAPATFVTHQHGRVALQAFADAEVQLEALKPHRLAA